VNVSSSAHRMGKMNFDDLLSQKSYSKWPAYGQSKLANLLFTFELDRKLKQAKLPIIAVACHPGYSATNLQSVGPKMEKSFLGGFFELGNTLVAQSAHMGALPTVRAAVDSQASGGEYFGPEGLFELRGYPTKVGCTSAAKDEASARTLWARSIELTKVDYAGLGAST
jgi:NAD(P)-dependent dehydrogenase (short-subunit alcohol dehydrogenase family)